MDSEIALSKKEFGEREEKQEKYLLFFFAKGEQKLEYIRIGRLNTYYIFIID